MKATAGRLALAAWAGLAISGMAAPATAQSLNDLGRVLQDQVLGNRPDPNRERDAYERGRQDAAEQARRDRDNRPRPGDDRRRFDEDRRRVDDDRRRGNEDSDRRQRDFDRQRGDQQRAWNDEQRARQQNGRY